MLADGCDPNFVVTIIVFSRGFLSLKNQWKKKDGHFNLLHIFFI